MQINSGAKFRDVVMDLDVMKDTQYMADTVRCVDGLVLRRNRNIMCDYLVIAL